MLPKDFSKLCTPARIYFVLALISVFLALYNGLHFLGAFVNLFFAFLWTLFLGWICDKISPIISWGLVLAPFIMMILVGIGLMREIRYVNTLNPLGGSNSVQEGLTGEKDVKKEQMM